MDIAHSIRTRREQLAPTDEERAKRGARSRDGSLTQTEAARRVGVTLRTWQRWEQPGSSAGLAHLEDIARALETTPAGVLGLEEPAPAAGSVEGRLAAVETQLMELTSALRGLATDPQALARAADELLAQELGVSGSDKGASAPKR